MDVKGAKALSERLAEAAGNVDPPPTKVVDSGDTSNCESVVATRKFSTQNASISSGKG
jgi:hypothetical protein